VDPLEREEQQDLKRAMAASLKEDGVRAAGAGMRAGSSRSRKKVAEPEEDECDEQLQRALELSIATNQGGRSQAACRPDEGNVYTDIAPDDDVSL
jgi:hypothetical protein